MESNDWKAKAYGLAEELKAEAQRGAAASQALRAVIARLCAAVSGLDPALDPLLSRLRDVARRPGEIAAIEAEVTRVADAVLRSGDAPRHEIPNQRLRELLGRMRWPDTLAAEVEAFKAKLADGVAPDAWVEVMEQLTALVAETVRDSCDQIRAAEEFLTGLTARLEELDTFMQKGSLLRDQSLAGVGGCAGDRSGGRTGERGGRIHAGQYAATIGRCRARAWHSSRHSSRSGRW